MAGLASSIPSSLSRATQAPRILISAGEPSGDAHAGPVAKAMLRKWPAAHVEALGGPALSDAGASVRFRMEAYTVMGFAEALTRIPAHLSLLHRLGKEFRQGRYDLVVLVDYPDFNLRLARAAHAAGIPTLYYIAPQLWAWRRRRAGAIRERVDRLAVILPFEEKFFADLGIPAAFVGHPLVERSWPSRTEARRTLGLREHDRVLTLFPGSREQEVRRLWPTFRDAGLRLLEEGACDHVTASITTAGAYPLPETIALHQDQSTLLLAAADAALVKSGTTTLEAACAGTPMVVAYRVHPLTAVIARRVISVDRISLVNLVGEGEVVPEFLQSKVTLEELLTTLRPLLDPSSAPATSQRERLASVRSRLGAPGAAERVADLAEELLAA